MIKTRLIKKDSTIESQEDLRKLYNTMMDTICEAKYTDAPMKHFKMDRAIRIANRILSFYKPELIISVIGMNRYHILQDMLDNE